MDSRKIQSVGNRSYAVSLPKEWIHSNKLKAQDILYIDTTKDNNLLISTKHDEPKKEIEVKVDEIYNITEFIMFCYVKNVDKLILKSNQFDYKKTAKIRRTINFLEGYDIVSEEPNKIEIAFLFKDIQITVQDIHRRILYLLNTMLEAMYIKDSKNVEECENGVDKLYHLSKRIIISCIKDKKLRQDNGITNLEDLFFLKDISKKLEKIGDEMFELSYSKITLSQQEKIKELLHIISQVISQKREVNKIGEALENFKCNKTNNVESLISKIYERCRDIFENSMAIEYNKKYFS